MAAPKILSKTYRPFICPSCAKSSQLNSKNYATAVSPEIYDVVCIGGGPAGLSLLTALRACTKSWKLDLID